MTLTPEFTEKAALTVLSASIGVVGALIGVFVKGRIDRSVARRIELRSRVDKIETMIDELEARASEYWRIPPGDPRLLLLASDVKRLRSRIGNEISRLDQLGFACGESCNPLVADFNFAATGEMFEVRDRPAQPYRGARISDAAGALQKQLRDVLKIV